MMKLVFAAVAALFSVTAMAGDRAYIQANIGSPSSDLSNCVDSTGQPAKCTIKGEGGKLLAGYKVAPNFALEATYFDFGTDHALLISGDQVEGDVTAFGLGGALHFNMTESWAGVARFGFAKVKTKVRGLAVGTTNWIDGGTESHAKYYAGCGVSYAITPMFKLHGDFDYTKVRSETFEEHGMKLLTVGGSINF